MATRMQQRRGTAAQWTSANPILNVGEIGYETDTNQFKIGDGTNHWDDLAYFVDQDTLNTSLGDYVEVSLLGVANGVATLNSLGKISSSQIPNIDELAQDAVDTALTAGTGITKTYNDNANTITISVDTSVIATKAELAEVSQDSLMDALSVENGITKSYDDSSNTIVLGINSNVVASLSGIQTLTNKNIDLANNVITGTINNFNQALTDGNFATTDGVEMLTNKTISSANNTITVTSTNVSDFTEAAVDVVANALVFGEHTNISVTYNDGAGTIGITAAPGYSDENAQDAVGNNLGYGLAYEDTLGQVYVNTSQIQVRIADVSDTEISYLANVTSDIQTQINSKASSTDLSNHESDTTNVHGIANTAAIVFTTDSGTVTGAMIASGAVTDANISQSAEISQSKIKSLSADLAGKASLTDLSNHESDTTNVHGIANTAAIVFTTDTGTVTSTMIANQTIVNDDISESAAIAQSKIANLATDLASKASLSGATFTGSVEIDQNLTVDGNFVVNGSNVLVSATQIQVEDSILQLAHQNANNTVDLGLVVSYNDGTQKHAGLVKDTSDSKWKLFKDVTDEPATTVNFGQGSLDSLAVGALEATSLTVGNVSNTEFGYLANVTSDIQAQISSKASATDLSNHEADTTNVHGIANTSLLVTTTGTQTLTNKTINTSSLGGDVVLSVSLDDFVVVKGSNTAAEVLSGASFASLTSQGNLASAGYYLGAYGSGKYVVIQMNSSSQGYHSPDGTTWTSFNLPFGASWQKLRYVNNTFVAIPQLGSSLAYSTDGVTWSSANLPSNANWNDIRYGGGEYLLVGSGTLFKSSSLTSWTSVSVPDNEVTTWYYAYGNGKWVAVGRKPNPSGESRTATSTDLINWTVQTVWFIGGPAGHEYISDKFVAIRSTGFGLGPAAVYSSDGISWTAVGLSGGQFIYNVNSSNGYVYAGLGANVAYSTNGVDWTVSALPSGYDEPTPIAGAQASQTPLEYLNGVTSNIQTQINSKISASSTDTLTNKTLANAIVTGTVTANGGVGSSGQYLESTGTGVRWTTVSGYSAPTLGTTSIASGATVTTVDGLTLTAARPRLTMNPQTGTSYTLVLSDASSRWVTCDNSGAITVTVPPSVFSVGDSITVQQIGAGQVTFAQGSGVTITSAGVTSSAPRIRTRFASATIVCTASNNFTVVGDIV